MANIVRIGSKSPKILVSKMVWLGVRNGAKMVKIGGKWGEKSKIFQAVPGSKMVNFTPLGLFKAVFMGFRAFSRAKNTKKRSARSARSAPRINFFFKYLEHFELEPKRQASLLMHHARSPKIVILGSRRVDWSKLRVEPIIPANF